jgi:hypothetical protein
MYVYKNTMKLKFYHFINQGKGICRKNFSGYR